MKLVMIEDMYEIVITLLIRSDSFSFIYEHFTNGYHVYLKVWIPLLDECLFGNKEQSNGVDKNAVAVICLNNCRKEELVSYVPQSISKVVSLYLSLLHCYLELEVTGKRVYSGVGYGLKITARLRFYGSERVT